MISVSAVHFAKAFSSMLFTELPIVTEVKPLQPENAELPIEVTELGIVTEVKPVQPLYLQVVLYQLFAR